MIVDVSILKSCHIHGKSKTIPGIDSLCNFNRIYLGYTMKTTHIIIIAVVAIVIMFSLIIGFGMMGMISAGNIGVIEIESVIVSSKYIVDDLKVFKDDPAIKAVIIRVDSPGGVVAASWEIYDEIRKVQEKKKVVVSMGTVAASGGYHISLPADVIVANPATLTGSIGVIMEFPIIEDLLKKIGVDFQIVKSKEYKDIGSPHRRMTEDEKALLKDVVLDVYDQFVETVVQHRHLPKDTVLKYADGRIFTGRQAYELGLVDTLGSFEDAVKIAGDLVGIDEPKLIYPPQRLSFIDLLIRPVERLLVPRIQYLWR
jgi:protease-4